MKRHVAIRNGLILAAALLLPMGVPAISPRNPAPAIPRPTSAQATASLDAELPSLVAMADLARDRRGGSGRRDLSDADYGRIESDLAAGARVPDLRESFGIGTTRARRITEAWEEVKR